MWTTSFMGSPRNLSALIQENTLLHYSRKKPTQPPTGKKRMGPFYLISDSKKWTIIINVSYFNTMYETDWGALFAFMFVVILPLLIIYFLLQKYIISGLTAGSVKR